MSLALKCVCGNSSYFLRSKAHNVGAYCTECSKWIKWVGKSDVDLLKRKGYRVHSENYEHPSVVQQKVLSKQDVVEKLNLGVITEPIVSQLAKRETVDLQQPTIAVFESRQDSKMNIFSLNCKVCNLGELEEMSKSKGYTASVFQGVLSFVDFENETLLASYKLNFCPGCGRSL